MRNVWIAADDVGALGKVARERLAELHTYPDVEHSGSSAHDDSNASKPK